jgi:hypothetical protein
VDAGRPPEGASEHRGRPSRATPARGSDECERPGERQAGRTSSHRCLRAQANPRRRTRFQVLAVAAVAVVSVVALVRLDLVEPGGGASLTSDGPG